MGGLAAGAGALLGGGAGSSMLLQGLSTGLSAGGSIIGGNEDAAALRYKAGLYEEGADATRIAGNINEGQRKAETTRKVGDQKAAFAANGLDASSRVIDNVTDATQFAGDMDAAILHYNTTREAFGQDTSAAMYRSAAKSAKTAGVLGAVGSLIGGASGLSSKWNAFKDSGAGAKADPYARLNEAELRI